MFNELSQVDKKIPIESPWVCGDGRSSPYPPHTHGNPHTHGSPAKSSPKTLTKQIKISIRAVSPFDSCPAKDSRAQVKKVKFSHTRYRALGPELIPVYRQSARR